MSKAGAALASLIMAAAATASVVQPASAPPPVFVLLVSTIEDHLNESASLERIERTLPVIERYRKEYPGLGASWLVRLTGTVSDRLAETNYGTGLLDRLKRAAADGLLEFGYDGTDEPTFVARPRPNFRKAGTPEDRWLARTEAIEWFLTEGKDPVTGEPIAGRSGGLRRTLDVVGPVEAVRGITMQIGGDPELAYALQRMGLEPLMPGFGDNTTYPGRTLAGYRGGTGAASAVLSPDETIAPELFWQDGLLTLSEFVSPDTRVVNARDGEAAVRRAFEALDRSRPHVVQVRLAHPAVYAKPGFGDRRYQTPLEFSYENPRSPTLPAEALRSDDERAGEYAREDEALRWLVTDYFAANPGSRFVSVGELKRMAGPAAGFEVSREDIAVAARQIVPSPGTAPLYVPTFVPARGRYLSLSDVFSLLLRSLAREDESGGPPALVRLSPLYGPRDLARAEERSVGTRVTRRDVLRACSHLSAALFAPDSKPIPNNTVPTAVAVAGLSLSAAQFLLLMADTYLQTVDQDDSRVRLVLPFSPVGESFPGTRPLHERGTTWTLKPARILHDGPSTAP